MINRLAFLPLNDEKIPLTDADSNNEPGVCRVEAINSHATWGFLLR